MFTFLEQLFGNRHQKAPSRAQWFARVENLERLREILTDPVFVAATNHLLDARRMGETVLFATPDALQRAAAFTAGHATFLSDLEQLATAPIDRSIEPLPFEHVQADPYGDN